MYKKYILPLIALIGAVFALFVVYHSNKKPPVPAIAFPPPVPPYIYSVAGAGKIEAASEDIFIGTPFNELIEEVYVKAGDKVKEKSPLFRLDIRALKAELNEAHKQKLVAKSQMENEEKQFSFYKDLKDKNAVSQSDYETQYYSFQVALDEYQKADAVVKRVLTDIEKSTITAPINGTVLQIKARVGQVAEKNPFTEQPLMVFGNTDIYHIRVDIDEEDSWRIVKNRPATAFVRGNSSISIPLEFLYIEPYVIPKTSLTGENQERVDTRVLQVIYSFNRDNYPVYIGQVLDVYIEALPDDKKFP